MTAKNARSAWVPMSGLLRRIRRTIPAVALVLAFGTVPANAADAQGRPQASFCFNDFPPYSTTVDGTSTGISVEIMREAGKRIGIAVKLQELPWNRCLDDVRNGHIDAVLDAADRKEFLQGPASYSVYTNTLWVRSSSPMKMFRPADFSGLVVGLVDGYDYPPDLIETLKSAGARFDRSVDDRTNAQKLAFGRFDALIGDYASTSAIARDQGLDLRALVPTPSADRLYVSFNPERAALQRQFDKTIAAMLSDGTIDAIYRRQIGIGLCEIWPALMPGNCPITAQASE